MIGRGWEFWIDRGGTFTDVVARSPAGELKTLKLLSVDPERYDDAAVAGIERLLAAAPAGERAHRRRQDGHDGRDERAARAARRADGARDHGRARGCHSHRRPAAARDLRARHRAARDAVRARRRGRRAHRRARPSAGAARHGEAARAISRPRARPGSTASRSCCCTAIVFRSTSSPPRRSRARSAFKQVSVSHRVLPLPKLVVRGDTTLADAYLSPVLDRYVASVRRGLDAPRRRRAALLHAEPRRAHRRGALPRQGQPALGTGRRRHRHGARRARRRCATRSSASTWAARRRTSRCTPASSSARPTP